MTGTEELSRTHTKTWQDCAVKDGQSTASGAESSIGDHIFYHAHKGFV